MKKKIQKAFSSLMIVLVAFTTILGSAPIEVKALATNVTGDQILARAKAYEFWGYSAVGTCTGFVTRVLDDLGIGDSIVGSMVGSSARYSPDQMLANARANPNDARLVYEGNASGAYSAGVKNGDLAIATASDMGSSFGHVAFIEIRNGVIGWYGANNAITNVGWQPFSRGTRGTDIGSDFTRTVHIFRLVDDVQPSYADLTSTKEATEEVKVSLTKTDIDTGKPLSDANFDFYRDDVRFAQNVKTNANGVATATSTVKFSGTSKSYRYCSNYGQLSDQKKQEVINAGIYTSKAQAQAVADAEAQQIANEKANQQHSYSVIETLTKTKYWLNADNDTVSNSQTGSGSVNMSLTNARVRAVINLIKVDSETGERVPQGDATLNGAIYGLYARENILDPADNSVIHSAGKEVARVAINDTSASVSDLYLGKYYWKEIKAPTGYNLDTKEYDVDMAYVDQNTPVVEKTITVREDVIKGKLKIAKKDKDTGKVVQREGFEFKVYFHDGTLVDTVTTGTNGYATTKALPYGSYYFYESHSGSHYIVDTETKTEAFVETNNSIIAKEFKDVRVNATLNLTKEDSEYGNSPQGDATLQGAVYGLYAKNDIMDPSNDGTVLKKKDSLIEKVTIKDSKAVVKNLYLGEYYWKEIIPSEGYTLDPTKYDVTPTWEGENTITVKRSTTVKETVMKQAFEIIKVSSDGSSDNDVPLLEGAEFTYILTEYVAKYGSFDKALKAIKAGETDIKDSEWGTMTTDKKGYAKSKELPYGHYTVSETIVPDEHVKVNDFTVTVNKDSREPQQWKVINDATYTSMLAIVKQDAETGKTVQLENATFKIYDIDNQEYIGFWKWNPLPVYMTEFKTDESGQVFLPEVLEVGNYRLEEIKSPEGYTLNTEPVNFKITEDNVTQVGPDAQTPVLTVFMQDTSVKGKINVYKEGEVLVSTSTDKDGNVTFNYEKKKLSDAVYEVFADEDIYSADNQGDLIYAKGTKVDTITTNKNGKATSKELPLGKYVVKEKTAPNGFTINETEKEVELKYEDQDTAIVYEDVEYTNDRQKVSIKTQKKDADTDKLVADAEFTLFVNEDIVSFDGTVLVKAGSKIETVTTTTDGKANVLADLPLGSYTLKETKAPLGYASTDKEFVIDASYQGQSIPVIKLEYEFVNEPTVVSISKQDITSEVETAGNVLQVFDSKGTKVDEWTSVQGEQHIIKYLHVGEEYTLVEYLAREGYLKAEDVKFTISDTGEVQPVVMKDERVYGQITVHKTGEVLVGTTTDETGNISFVYRTEDLANAVYEVYANENIKHPDGVSEDIYKKDELVATLTTGADGTITTDKLPLGRYRVEEKTAPEGFVNNNAVQFADLVYEDQYTELVFNSVSYENERQKVEICVKKQDSDTGTFLSGAEFTLFAGQDIVDVNGKVLINKDSSIEKVVTGTDGKAKFKADMPLGLYYVKETKAPIGYASNDTTVNVDARYQGQDVTLISTETGFVNDITKVEVSKTDITTGAELAGNHLTVFEKDNEGAVFDTWVSGAVPHMIYGLEVGKTYVLRETSSAYGFAISKDIEFTIADTGEVQKVKMENKLVEGQLAWNKTGEIFMATDTGMNELGIVHTPVWEKSNLLGSEITIYADEDITLENGITYFLKDETIEVLESDWDTVYSQKLPVGKYYYVETKVPHGRIPDTEKHYFEVVDNQKDELQVIESELENGRTTYELDFTKRMEFSDTSINKEAYKDVVFGIFALDDTYNYVGEVAMEADTLIGTSGIDEEGHLVQKFDLPVGNYYLKELATNSAYTLDENKYPFSIDMSSEEKVR